MNKFFTLLALLAGLGLPVQVALNNKLTSFSGNAVTSSLISFTVGTVALLLYSISNPTALGLSLRQVTQAPAHAWLGGLLGAFYIITSIVASPKIGIAFFLGLIIGGQLVMSLILEHYGLLGIGVKPFSWIKGVGVILVVVGILLIKK